MPSRVTIFAIITLLGPVLLGLGVLFGGLWIAAAFLYLTAFAMLLDQIVGVVSAPDEPDTDFPGAERLPLALGLIHFPLMVLAVWTLARGGLSIWEWVLAFFAFGLFFGQVSNANAHELIHRAERWPRRLGTAVYVTHLFGHHASAHPKIHHRHVATDQDPNTARFGESFYQFAVRAWLGSYRQALRAETELWRQLPDSWWQHVYVTYVAGALASCLIAFLIGGVAGLAIYVALASYATMQLLMSDYVQHYGLRRRPMLAGKPEPVGPQHSWNAPHWFSTYLMMAAPRHSDHHSHPSKPYIALDIGEAEQVPTLPYSLPVMGFLALHPKRWRRVMDPLVAKWVSGTVTPD